MWMELKHTSQCTFRVICIVINSTWMTELTPGLDMDFGMEVAGASVSVTVIQTGI